MSVKTDRLHFEQYQDMIARLYPELGAHEESRGNIQKHGKNHVLSRTVTFQVTDYCNLKCFPAGTKILMADFTYKNIEDVAVGDEVMSFDTKASKGKQITLSKTKVKYIFHRHDKVRKITTAQGATIYATDEHPFLDDRKNWRRTETITPKTKLMMFNGIVEHDIPDIDDVEYRTGYVVGAWLGDGTMAYYKNGELKDAPTSNYQNRFVVKDIECTNQLEQFMRSIGIDITVKPFAFGEVSYPAIFAQGAVATEHLRNLIESNLATNTSIAYAKGFLAGLIDTEGNVGGVIRITNTSDRIINEVTRCANLLNIEWAKADTGTTPNYDHKWTVTLHGELLALLSTIRPAIPRKSLNGLLGKSVFSRVSVLDNELIDTEEVTVYNMETESHVYIANNFLVHNCTYCYQINKKTRMMSQETARKFVDLLLSGDKGFKDYVDPSFSPAIIIEFIGGEPFNNVDLIDYVCTYFYERAIELRHPWAEKFMISICSNGTLYFEPKVQKFLKKWKNNLSFSVTIDGDKELHDSCRVFPDGSGSYDLAVAAAKDWMSKGYYMGSKITIAPGNIDHVSHAIKHMVEMGYKEINCNCVYEKGWTQEHSTKLYYQLKDACQYLLDNNLEKDIYVSILEDTFFAPKLPNDTQTWCGGLGDMLSCDPDGYLYPCIRYMESSLGDERPPIRIGSVDTGICQCEEEKCTLCEICGVTRRTYNTDECFFCPIAGGCADCAAYNYQDSGTVYHRATYICEMHKARCLVNAWYWAQFYTKYDPEKKFVLHMPDEWSLKIIPKEELDMIKSLPNVEFLPETWEQVRDGFESQGIYKEYMINEHKAETFKEKD